MYAIYVTNHSSLRLDFWISFLSFSPNLSFSYLDDFVADVGKWAGNCIGDSVEN